MAGDREYGAEGRLVGWYGTQEETYFACDGSTDLSEGGIWCVQSPDLSRDVASYRVRDVPADAVLLDAARLDGDMLALGARLAGEDVA